MLDEMHSMLVLFALLKRLKRFMLYREIEITAKWLAFLGNKHTDLSKLS